MVSSKNFYLKLALVSKGAIMNNAVSGLVTIITAIIGVAIVAVIVSKNADTANVITSGGNALSSVLKAATGPVSGYSF